MNMNKFTSAMILGVLVTGCRPVTQQSSRIKSGIATTASVSMLLSSDKKIEVVHNHPDAGPENYKANKVELSLAAVSKQTVDLAKTTEKQLLLTPLNFKMMLDATSGKNKLSCAASEVKMSVNAMKLACVLEGADSTADSNTQTVTSFKLPTGLSENVQLAWTNMDKVCLASGGNLEFGNEQKVLMGCYCAKPGVQLAFKDFEQLVNVSPDEAAEQFKRDCYSTTSKQTKLVDEMAAKCVAPFGQAEWTKNVNSCGCSSSTQSVLILYADFFAMDSPLSAFEARLKSTCEDTSGSSNSNSSSNPWGN